MFCFFLSYNAAFNASKVFPRNSLHPSPAVEPIVNREFLSSLVGTSSIEAEAAPDEGIRPEVGSGYRKKKGSKQLSRWSQAQHLRSVPWWTKRMPSARSIDRMLQFSQQATVRLLYQKATARA